MSCAPSGLGYSGCVPTMTLSTNMFGLSLHKRTFFMLFWLQKIIKKKSEVRSYIKYIWMLSFPLFQLEWITTINMKMAKRRRPALHIFRNEGHGHPRDLPATPSGATVKPAATFCDPFRLLFKLPATLPSFYIYILPFCLFWKIYKITPSKVLFIGYSVIPISPSASNSSDIIEDCSFDCLNILRRDAHRISTLLFESSVPPTA